MFVKHSNTDRRWTPKQRPPCPRSHAGIVESRQSARADAILEAVTHFMRRRYGDDSSREEGDCGTVADRLMLYTLLKTVE